MQQSDTANNTFNTLSSPFEGRITNRRQSLITGALLLLVGIALRTIILAVPPVLPLIQHDLHLTYTATGLLSALPTLIMGLAAWFIGITTEKMSGRIAVAGGLLLLTGGALLRAAFPITVLLYLFTVLLSLGIALTQTTIPVLIRMWFPLHIGLVTALFTDGLILGETMGASATVPLMNGLLGKDAWTASFILWGLPVAALLLLWLWFAPATPHRRRSQLPDAAVPALPSNITSSSQKRVSAWQLGLVLGSGSLVYFGMNNWIAVYNQATHRAGLTLLALGALNASQLPASIAITFFAQRLSGRRWPFVLAGCVCTVAMAGWLFAPASLETLWAVLLGASSALVFTLGLALPPLLAEPTRVARLTGGTLSLGYSIAFFGPFIGGGLWDLFQVPALVFLPIGLASVCLIGLGLLLPVRAPGTSKNAT